MKRFAFLLLVLIGLGAPSASSDETRAYADGLLWRVESPNAAASYVFGTIHIADPRVQAVVRETLASVGPLDSISLEVLQTPEATARASQRMIALDGPRLSERLGADLFARTVAAAAPYGLNAVILERFKPWAVAVILSVPVSEMRAQASGRLNSERILQVHAIDNQIALYEIETYDEQLSLFDRLAEADQIEMLRLVVQNSDTVDEVFARVVDAYLARDLNRVYRLMEEMAAGQGADLQAFFESEFIEGRNHRMVDRIRPRLAEGNALIAVGALHLPDEAGVLRLLEQQRYTITRMPVLDSGTPAR